MTVKELKIALENYPDDYEVVIDLPEGEVFIETVYDFGNRNKLYLSLNDRDSE